MREDDQSSGPNWNFKYPLEGNIIILIWTELVSSVVISIVFIAVKMIHVVSLMLQEPQMTR